MTAARGKVTRAADIVSDNGQHENRWSFADRMRPITITPDYMPTAEGSALIEIGNTKVICTASVEDGTPAFMRGRQRTRLGDGRVRDAPPAPPSPARRAS